MNKVLLLGRLTKDIEIKKTQSNLSVCDFSLAINQGKDKDAEFVNCQAWKETSELLAKYVKKGQQVAIEGRIHTSSYDGQNGKVYRTYVVVDRLELIGNREAKQEQMSNNSHQEQTGEYEPLKGHEEPLSTGPFKPSDLDSDCLPFY